MRVSAPIRPSWLWLPVAGYMAAIFLLSSMSNTPSLPSGTDKNLHALLYAGLSLLLVRALARGERARVSMATLLAAVSIATLYGVSDEVHQSFVPARQADVWDVVADASGAALAAGVVLLWVRSTDSGRSDRRYNSGRDDL